MLEAGADRFVDDLIGYSLVLTFYRPSSLMLYPMIVRAV